MNSSSNAGPTSELCKDVQQHVQRREGLPLIGEIWTGFVEDIASASGLK
jgi:hypothetical protein